MTENTKYCGKRTGNEERHTKIDPKYFETVKKA